MFDDFLNFFNLFFMLELFLIFTVGFKFFYFPSSLIATRMHSEVKEITFYNLFFMPELFLIFTVGFKFFYFPSSLIATRMHSEVKEITFYNLFFMPELFLIFTVGFKWICLMIFLNIWESVKFIVLPIKILMI